MTKSLLKNSSIYVLGDVLNKAVPFLMLPVLTRYFTPEDYGVISVFGVFVAILAVFTGLSIHGAISVNYYTMKKEDLKVYIGNCMIILNISTILVLLIVYILQSWILEKLNMDTKWLYVAVFLSYASFVANINLSIWMAEQKPKPYSIYQVLQTLTVTTLIIIFVIGFGMNWEGQLIANAIGVFVFSMVSFVLIVKRGYLVLRYNAEYINDALKFGIPLIPHVLGGLIRTGADRIIIMSILGATATGVYAVGYQMGMVISVLVIAFNKAWSPYLFNVLSSSPTIESKKKMVLFTYLYFIGILVFALIYSFVVNMCIPYFLGDKFGQSSDYIIYFSVAFAFEGMYYMVANYIFYAKKTHILAYVTFVVALLHIGLIYLLIGINGVVGVAQASVISSVVTFTMVWLLANRVYGMPWNIFKL